MFLKHLVAAAALAGSFVVGGAQAQTPAPLPSTSFNVVGSIGGLSMYTSREVPFWTEIVPKASGGAIKVQVKPFTELGFRAPRSSVSSPAERCSSRPPCSTTIPGKCR